MATVESAFTNLQSRLKAQNGVILDAGGAPMIGDKGSFGQAAAQSLRGDDGLMPLSGIVSVDGHPFQTVAAPVMAPDRLGWVVFGTRLDAAEMQNMQTLSALPIQA